MFRCPRCHRFGLELRDGLFKCVWSECGYISKDKDEIDTAPHPVMFKKFIDSLRKNDVGAE